MIKFLKASIFLVLFSGIRATEGAALTSCKNESKVIWVEDYLRRALLENLEASRIDINGDETLNLVNFINLLSKTILGSLVTVLLKQLGSINNKNPNLKKLPTRILNSFYKETQIILFNEPIINIAVNCIKIWIVGTVLSFLGRELIFLKNLMLHRKFNPVLKKCVMELRVLEKDGFKIQSKSPILNALIVNTALCKKVVDLEKSGTVFVQPIEELFSNYHLSAAVLGVLKENIGSSIKPGKASRALFIIDKLKKSIEKYSLPTLMVSLGILYLAKSIEYKP